MECRGKFCSHLGTDKSCVFNVPIFNDVTMQEATQITEAMTSKTIPKGDMIFNAGDIIDAMYVIHVGKVKVFRISEDGKEQIITVLGSKDFLGELSLFSPTISKNNVQAIENTFVCVIETEKLKNIILKYPQIALKILKQMSKRMEKAENMIEKLGAYDAEQRIAAYLLELFAEGNDDISMSKKDLASYLGTTQETLSRKLSTFQERGWIKLVGQRKIQILNMSALEAVAKG